MDTKPSANAQLSARPVKRARKIVNCNPCRSSKLKCDKGRPCSSCVLRGTVSQCYQGQNPQNSSTPNIDTASEFARIKYSILLLENHFARSYPREAAQSLPPSLPLIPRTQRQQQHGRLPTNIEAPGLCGRQSQSGLYTGPTSVASHLLVQDVPGSRSASAEPEAPGGFAHHDYDRDLLDLLPPFYVMDGLIEYYFEYCTWVYWMVNKSAFLTSWRKFKNGTFPDRLVLATASFISALALRYLPLGHDLLSHLPTGSSEEDHSRDLSVAFYEIGNKALRRYQDEANLYTIDLVEALLAKCHYFVITAEPERTWTIRGELVTTATAMGLHRDPDNIRFSRDGAERRRWAWWHIMFIDRGQSFMFGRPFSIASHHFNTQLPAYCDSNQDKSGRLYLYHTAVFRLMFILGELMDDAVSLRPVAYDSFRNKDRLLEQWLEDLSPELQLDDFRLAQGLVSPITSVRRITVQSLIVRTAFHHIRLTIHRPFSRIANTSTALQSLEISVASASKVISLTALTVPDTSPADYNPSHSPIYGHMAWRPYHVFAAAMYFTFQLITDPEQPVSKMFKNYITKSLTILEHSPNSLPAQQSLSVLRTLTPLYSDQYLALDHRGRTQYKAAILARVQTLAFPHQDPPQHVPKAEGSLSNFNALGVDPQELSSLQEHFTGFSNPQSSGYIPTISTAPAYPVPTPSYFASTEPEYKPNSTPIGEPPSYYSTMGMSYPRHQHHPDTSRAWQDGRMQHAYFTQQQQYHRDYLHGDRSTSTAGLSATVYVPVADDWRGPVGFGQGEWMQFIGAHEGVEGRHHAQPS